MNGITWASVLPYSPRRALMDGAIWILGSGGGGQGFVDDDGGGDTVGLVLSGFPGVGVGLRCGVCRFPGRGSGTGSGRGCRYVGGCLSAARR